MVSLWVGPAYVARGHSKSLKDLVGKVSKTRRMSAGTLHQFGVRGNLEDHW